MTNYTATYTFPYDGGVAINLYLRGEWACGGVVGVTFSNRDAAYEAAYILASRVAISKGGTLTRFSEAA